MARIQLSRRRQTNTSSPQPLCEGSFRIVIAGLPQTGDVARAIAQRLKDIGDKAEKTLEGEKRPATLPSSCSPCLLGTWSFCYLCSMASAFVRYFRAWISRYRSKVILLPLIKKMSGFVCSFLPQYRIAAQMDRATKWLATRPAKGHHGILSLTHVLLGKGLSSLSRSTIVTLRRTTLWISVTETSHLTGAIQYSLMAAVASVSIALHVFSAPLIISC